MLKELKSTSGKLVQGSLNDLSEDNKPRNVFILDNGKKIERGVF